MRLSNDNGEFIEFTVLKYFDDSDDCELLITGKAAFLSFDFHTFAAIRKIKEFCGKLGECLRTLSGGFYIDGFAWENDFGLGFENLGSGHIEVKGKFATVSGDNRCDISFVTDQTFVARFVDELKAESYKRPNV